MKNFKKLSLGVLIFAYPKSGKESNNYSNNSILAKLKTRPLFFRESKNYKMMTRSC